MTDYPEPMTEGTNPAHIWRNGDVLPWDEAKVHVNAVGHASVSAVFEGIKAYWNPDRQQLYIFRLREHLERLLDSIRISRLETPYTLPDLVNGVVEILQANQIRQDIYIRPWCFIEGIVRHQIAHPSAKTEMVIDMWPFTSAMCTERGCRVGISSWTRIHDNVIPPRVKAFSNYHNSRLAVLEAQTNGHDWPLLLNDRHKVAEGPGACVALVRNGRVVTPDVSSSILESITRETMLMLLSDQLNVPVIEREVDRTELYVSDEVFFMGTGWEVLPILTIDGLSVGDGKMGPVTQKVDQAYHDIVRGIDTRYEDWRTPVW